MSHGFSAADAVETIRRDGIVVIEGLITPDQVERLRAEGETLRDRFSDVFGSTSPIKTRGGWRLDVSPTGLAWRGGAPMAREIGRVVAQPFLREMAHALLGPRWHAIGLTIDYREPTMEELPRDGFVKGYPPAYFWHVDNGLPGLDDPSWFTLRFQICLTDTTLSNGAFSFAKETHRLVKHVRRRINALYPGNTEIAVVDTYDSLIKAAATLDAEDGGLEPELAGILKRFTDNVPARDYSDERTVIAMPEGSIIAFDDSGMHRGNEVLTDHRYVYRFLFNRIRFKDQVRDLGQFKHYLFRQLYRWTSREPFASLM